MLTLHFFNLVQKNFLSVIKLYIKYTYIYLNYFWGGWALFLQLWLWYSFFIFLTPAPLEFGKRYILVQLHHMWKQTEKENAVPCKSTFITWSTSLLCFSSLLLHMLVLIYLLLSWDWKEVWDSYSIYLSCIMIRICHFFWTIFLQITETIKSDDVNYKTSIKMKKNQLKNDISLYFGGWRTWKATKCGN